ncbi:lipopolysaccharide transport periplasmic protein LptA [Corticimicrobacter populi]|uniref:Lipopolysaccharide export system protein LptA n=1 Tax=Corticimicrobacter populi TaxID=2175229 RepID=A0A2V1K2T5_9BURK|nr:lipopolysaccharide transport periplasmic protein LptA [Corticimicrobacter populi]PWF23875.1 lipopolysaccharide transport periplasmic protein LptA [Corticimicrobacter populi]
MTARRLSFCSRLCAGLLLGIMLVPAATTAQEAAEEPSTQILSDSLRYDDIGRTSVFTGNVILTRGPMTLTADRLDVREDDQGVRHGVASADKGKRVRIRQERPEQFDLIDASGLRAEYSEKDDQIDLIGQAVVIRYICGEAMDTIRGQRIRYNQTTGLYQAEGGAESAGPGQRVRSIAQPRSRVDAAIKACQDKNAAARP